MEFFSERREVKSKPVGNGAFFLKLRATTAIAMLLASTAPSWALGQQQTQQQAPATQATTQANPADLDPALQGLPPEPAPNYTQPLYMRPGTHDYSKPRGYWPNPLKPYSAMTAEVEPGRCPDSTLYVAALRAREACRTNRHRARREARHLSLRRTSWRRCPSRQESFGLPGVSGGPRWGRAAVRVHRDFEHARGRPAAARRSQFDRRKGGPNSAASSGRKPARSAFDKSWQIPRKPREVDGSKA